MHPFSTPWKHQKTLQFSDVFRRQRKGALGANGLRILATEVFKTLNNINHSYMKDIFKPKASSKVRLNNFIVQRFKTTKNGTKNLKYLGQRI